MTSKMPIKWHRQCYANQKASLERRRMLASEEMSWCANDALKLAFYGDQIIEADRRKLDGFDPERFMKKRPTKAVE